MARAVFGDDLSTLFWNVIGWSGEDEDEDDFDFEQALMDLPPHQAENTLERIERITKSVMKNPNIEEYRRISLDNPRNTEAIAKVPGAIDALKAAGWVMIAPSTLELPREICPTPREVSRINEAQDHYRRERIHSNPDRGVMNILAGG